MSEHNEAPMSSPVDAKPDARDLLDAAYNDTSKFHDEFDGMSSVEKLESMRAMVALNAADRSKDPTLPELEYETLDNSYCESSTLVKAGIVRERSDFNPLKYLGDETTKENLFDDPAKLEGARLPRPSHLVLSSWSSNHTEEPESLYKAGDKSILEDCKKIDSAKDISNSQGFLTPSGTRMTDAEVQDKLNYSDKQRDRYISNDPVADSDRPQGVEKEQYDGYTLQRDYKSDPRFYDGRPSGYYQQHSRQSNDNRYRRYGY